MPLQHRHQSILRAPHKATDAEWLLPMPLPTHGRLRPARCPTPSLCRCAEPWDNLSAHRLPACRPPPLRSRSASAAGRRNFIARNSSHSQKLRRRLIVVIISRRRTSMGCSYLASSSVLVGECARQLWDFPRILQRLITIQYVVHVLSEVVTAGYGDRTGVLCRLCYSLLVLYRCILAQFRK